ncbi:MAG: putative capsid protein [Cressdnaviricota sp.]|nr:MAG: putative capsid protein [Cressdnaviricota sp.]
MVRKYAKRAQRAMQSPLAKGAMSAIRSSKFGGTMSKIEKTANLLKDQQLFEGSSMSTLRMATLAIDLVRRQNPGRTLPAFSGNNRKVVIPTVSTGTVSTSVYGYKYNARPIPRKTGDVNTEVKKNSRYGLQSLANTQGVFDIPLLACSTLSSGANNYTSVTFQDAFETVFNVGGDFPVVPTTSTSIDQNRIALDRFESTLKLVNEGTGAVEVTIYDLEPKRDVPKATYSSRTDAIGLQSPSDTWATGMTNAVYVDDAQTPTVLGTIPTNNLKFNTFWKVMKRTKIELSGGSAHIHRGCNVLNTLFNHYDYSEVLGLRSMLCPTIMLVFSGMPTGVNLVEAASISVSTENILFARSAVNDNITVRNYDSNTL